MSATVATPDVLAQLVVPPACHDCALSPRGAARRAFLRRLGLAAAALALSPSLARAERLDAHDGADGLPPSPHDAASERRYAIPSADSIQVDRDNGVLLARASGRAYAFSLACPHQNTALRWDADAREFRCPKHKSRYRSDGTFIEGRATRAMDRLAIRRDGDALVVDVDTLYQQDEQPALWAAAYVSV